MKTAKVKMHIITYELHEGDQNEVLYNVTLSVHRVSQQLKKPHTYSITLVDSPLIYLAGAASQKGDLTTLVVPMVSSKKQQGTCVIGKCVLKRFWCQKFI